jgi:hypothetical protein
MNADIRSVDVHQQENIRINKNSESSEPQKLYKYYSLSILNTRAISLGTVFGFSMTSKPEFCCCLPVDIYFRAFSCNTEI